MAFQEKKGGKKENIGKKWRNEKNEKWKNEKMKNKPISDNIT